MLEPAPSAPSSASVRSSVPSVKTLQRHILEHQPPHAGGELTRLINGITLATKIIAAQVRRVGLGDLGGAAGGENFQGETILKMDRFADDTLLDCLGCRTQVGIMVSEENREPVVMRHLERGKYVVLFDPLDGSSNLDCNVAVGTIFSILQREPTGEDVAADVLQPGLRQVAAGYVLYSSSTVMAYTTGQGVHMFTLDPAIGAYVLSNEHVVMPPASRIYSCNEGNWEGFPASVQRYLGWARSREAGPYSSRYIGSLVADFHRTLLKGGLFLYPPTERQRGGKLRLLYEANPIAFLAEQAGGVATDGEQRILEKVPRDLHERTPLYVGGRAEMDRLSAFLRG